MLEFGLLFDVLMEAEPNPNPSSRHYQHKEGAVYHPHCIDKTAILANEISLMRFTNQII